MATGSVRLVVTSIGPSGLGAIDVRRSVRLERVQRIVRTARMVPINRYRRLRRQQEQTRTDHNRPAEVGKGLAPRPPARATDLRPRNGSATKAGMEKVDVVVAVLVNRGVMADTTTVAHHSGMVGMTSAALRRSGTVDTTSAVHLPHSTGMVDTTSVALRRAISGMVAVAAAAAGVDMAATGVMVTAAPRLLWVQEAQVEHQACHNKTTRCGNAVVPEAANMEVGTMPALV